MTYDATCNDSKKFQKIYLNVDLRLVSVGAGGGDWSHDSSRSCRHPSGSTLYSRSAKIQLFPGQAKLDVNLFLKF